MKGVSILGCTGTIGVNTLRIVEQFPDRFRVVALSAGRNVQLLKEQIRQFRPQYVSVQDREAISSLKSDYPNVIFGWGPDGLNTCALVGEAEIVVIGIVGFAALMPTIAAVRAKKRVALANKEVLVVGGTLFRKELESSSAECIPVDSEHNALFQLLDGRPESQVVSLILTASGGPFWKLPVSELETVTPERAIRHPNWKMGPKISVDSATLMNKGLELIEAHFLFGLSEDRIEIWQHPQSIVHGAIRLKDNSIMAQLSLPDMRLSIGYALSYPERLASVVPGLPLSELARLEFFEPDFARFPALKLAREALRAGPSHLVALNAANEVAVESFLKGSIGFLSITRVISETLARHRDTPIHVLEDIYGVNEQARAMAVALCR